MWLIAFASALADTTIHLVIKYVRNAITLVKPALYLPLIALHARQPILEHLTRPQKVVCAI